MMDDRRYEPSISKEDAAPIDDEEESDGEFEFPFVSRDATAGSGTAPADELFAGGRIRAFYPVFGRVLEDAASAAPETAEPPRARLGKLFQLEKARTSSVASTSSSSSSRSSASSISVSTDAAAVGGDLDSASPESYCLWTPGLSSSAASSPSRPPRKSGSTGSMSRWRRIGELVVGRSQSDGREKFLFLSAPPSPARDHASSNAKKPQHLRGSKATEVDTVAAGRRMSYSGSSATKGAGSPAARRTFLPYRQDLVGLFANVQGLRRSHHHPF